MPSIGINQLSRSDKRKVKVKLKRLYFRSPSIKKITVSTSNSCNQINSCNFSNSHYFENFSSDILKTDLHQETTDKPVFTKLLTDWATSNNITGTAVTSLLKVLKTHHCFSSIPQDCRTLRKTPRKIKIYPISPGQYCHFPLKETLIKLYRTNQCALSVLSVQLNVDGLPISRSSSKQFWPVLGHIFELPQTSPFVIGLYFGEDKPKSSNDLLRLVVDDILSCNKIEIDNCVISVKVHSVVCDAPARAFILNVKGHTGYYGCHKCNIEGTYFNHRMTFPGHCPVLRTNNTVRKRTHEDFHLQNNTELERLNIDLVADIPLDYQHLICLGVTRKLLYLWTKGKINKFRFQNRDTHLLSQRLISLKVFFPREFPRKPRSLQHLNNWKATEYRTFLLYVGPIVLKNLLPDDHYKHFLCLHVAIRILCCENLQVKYLDYAQQLLTFFVNSITTLYGQEQLSYNVHNLVHLADDSKRFGILDGFSTFKFENFLGKIKLSLKSGNRPLEQIFNRISEYNPRRHILQSKIAVKSNDFIICASKGNNCFLLLDGSVFICENLDFSDHKKILHGRRLEKPEPLYTSPCDSRLVGITKFSRLSNYFSVDSSVVKSKLIVFEYKNSFISVPLLHS